MQSKDKLEASRRVHPGGPRAILATKPKDPGSPCLTVRRTFSGDHTGKETPVPIPNTAVKLSGPMIVPTSAKVGIARFYLKTPPSSKDSSGVFAALVPILPCMKYSMDGNFKTLIESLEAAHLNWDFYEDNAIWDDVCENTISGQVISRVELLSGPRAVGLLTAFAARRSLACWFVYCEDTRPLKIIDAVIEHWLIFQNTPVPASWTMPTRPMSGNERIIDCRYSDTMSASDAVAHAAKYAQNQNLLDAAISLAASHTAFDCSPIGRVFVFEKWLIDYAIPIALEGREMTYNEVFADADFDAPVQIHEKL